ncbi:MAG: extracellular solute-binding protein [Planctomycetota bacterium]
MTQEPKLTALGKLVVLLFIAGCFYGAYTIFKRAETPGPVVPGTTAVASPSRTDGPSTSPVVAGKSVSIGIAYGTEKKVWLEWARERFAESPQGKLITVDLIPMGSQEGAQAIVASDKRINVWAPASAVFKDVFVQNWQAKNGGDPIIKEEQLALTPMVFVMWDERYSAFVGKYKSLNFKSVGEALKEKSGWKGIAQKPEWGFFKFGHTNPMESNSGLMALVLMTHDYQNKTSALRPEDIVNEDFQTWMTELERGVSNLDKSTGYLMKDMVLKGPSSYDTIFVYEQLAIEQLKPAEGRWSNLKIIYPEKNMWSDHPYYILNVPWSTAEQRKAAQIFLDFLMSEPIQTQAMMQGFRPGNTSVPIKTPESPFTRYEKYGLKIDLTMMCEPPKADAINNLLAGWQRNRGAK